MKFCIVTHKVIKGDGQGRVNYEIVQEAIRRGHFVTILASHVSLDLQQNRQVNWVQISVKGLPTELLRNLWFARRSAVWLRKNRSDFDLIQVNGAITEHWADVNLVHFVHSAWLQSPLHISKSRRDIYGVYQWIYTALNAYWEKKSFRAKVMIVGSEQSKTELLNAGVPDQNIRVILNGVDLAEFFPDSANSANRYLLGLPEDVTLAFFAGDIRTPRKNLDTVLHALTQVPELHLVVAGITEGSPYPLLSAKLNLSERVHFLGLRSDIAALMRAVDLLVFPSRYEPFGLVVIEAMATGLPVITTTTTGASDLITPACGIVLSNSEDQQALAEALKTLATDPERRSHMGQAARAIAEQHSWAQIAQTYVDLFEEIGTL